MASGIKNDSTLYYWSIIGGRFARKVEESTPNAVARVNKNNETVNEILASYIEGKIETVYTKQSEYGLELILKITDRGETNFVQMPINSNYAEDFLQRFPRIDFQDYNTINVFEKKVVQDGNTYYNGVLWMANQNNEKIAKYYTKEAPNGLPEWIKTTNTEGKTVFDRTNRINFYKAMIEAKFPPIEQAQSTSPTNTIATPPLPPPGEGGTDDLPF